MKPSLGQVRSSMTPWQGGMVVIHPLDQTACMPLPPMVAKWKKIVWEADMVIAKALLKAKNTPTQKKDPL